jgi:Ca-activated chloride channel family protein
VRVREVAFAMAAGLLVASATARSQSSGEASPAAAAAALEILSPTSLDTPVGQTLIRVFPKNIRPGDTLDFFVDGRKLASVTESPWETLWSAGETVRRHAITVALRRDGREIVTARVNTRDPGYADKASALAVALAPIVTDRSGRYVMGLRREDFTVLDDGRPQRIETFDAVDSPLAVVLVLDLSASMQPKLDDALAAARLFLKSLKPDDRLGLLTFNTGIVEFVPIALDRAKALETIDRAKAEGDTALYDAIADALRRIKPHRQRKAVVVFTDGEDNRSRFSVAQVGEMARASEVSIYTIAEGDVDPKTGVFLEKLSNETGGRSYAIRDISRLAEAFASIVAELRNQYFLTYTPAKRNARSWHSVDVRVARSDLVVRAKKRYFMP